MRRTVILAAAILLMAGCDSDGGNPGGDSGLVDASTDATIGDDTGVDTGADTVDDALPEDVSQDQTSPDVASPDVPQDTFEIPPFTPGACDQEAYEWLPAEQVGKVVWWEEDTSWQQPPEVLDALLAQFNFDAFSPLQYGTRVFKIRYTTQDRGRLIEATTMLGIPQPPDGSAATYSTALWLHGTTGFSDTCAPSRGLEGPGGAALMAALGFIGVAPDFIGLNGFGEPSETHHAYLVGEATAIASWDAVRASLELLHDPELNDVALADDRVVPWGASQGGHAAMFVDRYQPIYAPEFEVPGTLAIVPPSDLIGQADAAIVANRDGMANLTGFFVAAARWYDAVEAIDDLLTDEPPWNFASTLAEIMDSTCENPFKGVPTVEDVYLPGPLATLRDQGLGQLEPFACFARENSLGTTSVPRYSDAPMYVSLGESDTLVDLDTERKAVQELCAQGYEITFIECAGAGHAEAGVWTLVDQLAWIRARLAGDPLDASRTCVVSDPEECNLPQE
jgi:dienelactone hydrolase